MTRAPTARRLAFLLPLAPTVAALTVAALAAVALMAAGVTAGCGKYGPPVRTSGVRAAPPPPEKVEPTEKVGPEADENQQHEEAP